jgi:hypothetical protein
LFDAVDEQLLDLLPQCLAAAGLIMVSQPLRNGDQFRVRTPRQHANGAKIERGGNHRHRANGE